MCGYGGMADALDLGSSPKGCRFNSCYPHHLNFKYILSTGVEPARFIGFPKNRQIFRVIVPVISTRWILKNNRKMQKHIL